MLIRLMDSRLRSAGMTNKNNHLRLSSSGLTRGSMLFQLKYERPKIIHVLAEGVFATHNREPAQAFSAWKLKPFHNSEILILMNLQKVVIPVLKAPTVGGGGSPLLLGEPA